MPIKATVKLLRRTFLLCAALSFSAPLYAENAPDFHRWNTLVESGSTLLFYKTEAQLKNITTNNTSGSTLLHGKSELKREPAASPLTYTYVATPDLGYHFAHWSCTPIQITEVESSIYPFCYGESPNLTFNVNKGSDARTFKINLCPLFDPNTYTITFKPNGGTGTMAKLSMTYDQAKTLTANAFKKTGYSFKEWKNNSSEKTYADKASVSNLTSVDKGSIVLYAQWTNNVYTVSFDTQGGVPNTLASKIVTFNKAYNSTSSFPDNPTRAGYAFSGWALTSTATSGSITGDSLVQETKNHTLYATWTPNSYTVTYNANGGSVTPNSSNVVFGQKYQSLPSAANCTRTGYIFAGWYTAATGGNKVTADTVVSSSQNHALYAHWTANEYTVTFDMNGGDDLSFGSKSVTYDSAYGELPTCTRTGYTFAGWYTAAEGGTEIEAATQVTITAAQTLYAHWSLAQYKLNVTLGEGIDYIYYRVGNTESYSRRNYNSSISISYGETWSVYASPKSGYEYTEYSKSEPLSGTMTTAGASYSPIATPKKYTVTFDLNYNATPLTSERSYNRPYGELPSPTRVGYTFVEWTDSQDKSITAESIVPLGEHTLYAQWEAQTYAVSFMADGKLFAMIKSTFDSEYNLPKTIPTKEGYTFAGWFTAESGGVKVEEGSFVEIGEAHSLYARFGANEYTIVFDKNHPNAVAAPASKTLKYDDVYKLPDFAAKGEAHPNPSYRFVGWKHDLEDASDPLPSGTKVSKLSTGDDYTFYAIWELDLNDLSAAAHCKNAEVSSEDWEIVEGDPTSIRSKISAIGGNYNSKELSLAIRGSGTLYFLAKRSSTMSDKLSLHLRGEDNGVKIDKTIATTANWQLKSYSLTNVTKDFRLVIDYPEATTPFLSTTEDHRYYLDEIVWLSEGESYEESREKFEVTVTATNFASWSSIPTADANGVITVYDGDSVKVWGTPLEGYTTSYKSEETAYVLSSVKQNETIVLTATQDIQLSDLAIAANCTNIDITSSTNGGCWTKCTLDGSVGIWSAPTTRYTSNDDIVLTADVPGAGTLSFEWKTTETMSSPYLALEYRKGGSGAWTPISDPQKVSAEYSSISITFTEAAKFEWRATIIQTSKTATPTDTNNRFFLNKIKWLAEGEEDTPDDPPAKTELEQWAELLGCAATDSAVTEAKDEFAKNCKLTISFDATGKPIIGVTGVSENLAAKVKIECCEDLSNPIWTEHDPAQHTDCRFYRGTLDLGTSL